MITFNESGEQEAILACFKTLSTNLTGKLRKTMETLRIAGALPRFKPTIIQMQVGNILLNYLLNGMFDEV
jgi:hypothetical protein